MLGEEILQNEGNGDVRCDPDIESSVSDPKMSEAFLLDGFSHGVEDVLVGHLAVRTGFHLLYFGLGVVERQTAERGGKT